MRLPFPNNRPYSRDAGERQAERDRIRTYMLAAAELQITDAGRAPNCGEYSRPWASGPIHSTEPNGCRNDGSTCLCECHDVPSGAEPEETQP